jgi:uncharacterized protein YodC (DUF2158 family)
MSLKIGNTVQLKSGGPVMTVLKIEAGNTITCIWFATEHDEFRTQVFPEAVLEEIAFGDDEDEDDLD